MGRKKSKKITWADRQRIELLVKADFSVADIARVIGVTRTAIYSELPRGGMPYSADKAQQNVGVRMETDRRGADDSSRYAG